MLKIHQESDLTETATHVRLIYNKYSGMLLGFISQIINDRAKAEAQMISIFCELAKASYKERSSPNIGSWNELRTFALNYLPAHTIQLEIAADLPAQEQLSQLQHQVFNLAYYQKKSLCDIAKQLNQTEELIRKTLKEAFTVMKGKREN